MATARVDSLKGDPGSFRKLAVSGLVLIVLVGILAFSGVLAQARQSIPGLRQSTPTYQTTTVGKGNISVSVIATGPIAAVNSTPLTFKTSGKLTALQVGIGQHVTKGQVLAVLDTTDLQTALNQARANLDEAQASLTKVQSGVTQVQKDVAQVTVDNAKTSAASAQASVATNQQSAANGVTAAQNGVHAAELNLASAQDSLMATQDQETRGLAADQTAITNAQKNLDAVQAIAAGDVPIQETNLEKAKDALWAAQTSRDQTCSRSSGTDCQVANASVGSAQTALNAANLQMQQQLKQDQQTVAQAQTSLDQAKSTLANDQTKDGAAVVTAQNQVKAAQAALASAQTAVSQAQTQATATVQNAQAQAASAAGALKAAQASYNQTVAPPSAADVASAKAQVVNAQAAYDAAKTNLDAATLTAPFDATVAAINGAVGQYVNGGPVAVGGSALFTLMDLSNLQVTTQVNEADIGKVHVGDPVTFTVNAFPNVTLTGKVLTIQPVGTTSQNVVDYNVTCSIQPTKDATLYPGMTATATIVSVEHAGVLTIPNSALSYAQAQSKKQSTSANSATTGAVLTLKNGKPTTVPVTLGITDGTNTEIVSGLQPGETILLGQSTATSGSSSSTSGQRSGGGPPLGGFP